MTKRIAIVDARPDMLAFLKEQIEIQGYKVIACYTEEEVEAILPEPDLVLVDFEEFGVDLDDVIRVIEESLKAQEKPARIK